MKISKKTLAVLLIVTIVASLFGVLATTIKEEPKQPQPTPVIPPSKIAEVQELHLLGSDPHTLDPALAGDVGSAIYIEEIFSGLLTFDIVAIDQNGDYDFIDPGEPVGDYTPEEIKKVLEKEIPANFAFIHEVKTFQGKVYILIRLAPDLAKEVPEPIYNPDGTVSYIFKIREDAFFHSGKKVDAWDFVYSFERAADPKTGSTTCELYLGDIIGVMDMQNGLIKNRINKQSERPIYKDLPGLEVLDDLTLKITIDGPKPYFLWKLTYPTAMVVNKIQTEAVVNWTNRPDGTGPFRLVKYDFGREIILERNDNYHLTPPKLEKIYFDLAGGQALTLYKAGKIDIAGVGLEQIDQVRDPNNPLYDPLLASQYLEGTSMDTFYLAFNVEKPPFDDPKVRKAFAMAIDRKELAEVVLKNLVVPAKGILPPGIPGYRPDLEGIPYDPEGARKLLAESKYGGPEGLPTIVLHLAGQRATAGPTVERIVYQWKTNLGVEVEIEKTEWGTFLQELRHQKYQVWVMGWIADYPDPEDFLDLKFHSSRSVANRETKYSNPQVDKLLELARTEPDPQKRIKLYQQAEDIIIEDCPWIPLFHSKDHILVKPYVKGYLPMPLVIPIFKYIYIVEE